MRSRAISCWPPNPGYPVFSLGPQLAGAKIETYPLHAENNFLPRFEDIPAETARVAKFMIVSYPSNPVCSVADDAFYEELIAFAKKYNIIILHDNAYSDIIYDGREGKSFRPIRARRRWASSFTPCPRATI